eukprot:GFUD01085952.1.p1 GENE.GFUD01085952.1~~GFUD01085952.1.p1  ORF type:complete len:152 (-),score=25.48 GFUD01085952.1:124-552(-)
MTMRTILLSLLFNFVHSQIKFGPDCGSPIICHTGLCSNGSRPPTPPGQCCPDLSLCVQNCPKLSSCENESLCWDGSQPPTTHDQCCPDIILCPWDCRTVRCAFCGPRPERCKDGSVAPAGEDCCACPDRKLCKEGSDTVYTG